MSQTTKSIPVALLMEKTSVQDLKEFVDLSRVFLKMWKIIEQNSMKGTSKAYNSVNFSEYCVA
jgi:hypothetical protein